MTNGPRINASGVEEAVKSAARFIENEVFNGRVVRVSFSEKRLSPTFGPRLKTAYAVVRNAANRVHNYPLSIAGWALVEGRVVAWPQEKNIRCDFDQIREMGKLGGA